SAAQRHLGADRVAGPELEPRDRLLRPRDQRLLTGDDGEVGDGPVEQRRLLRRQPDSGVEDDLLEPPHLPRVAQPELALQLGTHLGLVALLEARSLACGLRHQRSPSHFLQMRTFLPLSSKRYPTRVGPHLSHRMATFEASTGMSLSMMPACIVARV